jgi:hypothetical protein
VTDSNGLAVVNYKINTTKTGTGVEVLVTSTATMTGYVAGAGITTFAIE